MVWVHRIAVVLGFLALLLGAGFAWLVTAKPWIPKLEMVDPSPAGRRVADAGFVANFYPAVGAGARPAVLVLGGSEGGLGSEMTAYAKALQAEGYSALHVGYHRGPGMSPTLENVPLELFEGAIAWLKAQPGVDPTRLAVVGWSRGSEAAQLLAATHPEMRAVILGMPSNVVWAGFDWEKLFFSDMRSPAWTRGGAPVPYVAVSDIGRSMNVYAPDWQAKFRAMTIKRPEIVIPVEAIGGRVLYVCGEQDRLWPSCPMARLGAERAAKAGKTDVEVLAFKDAGHFGFGVPLAADDPRRARLSALGGTPAGNEAALAEGLEKAKALLAAAFTQAPTPDREAAPTPPG
ncbi:MAG: hypothetical protein K2Q06_10130 [Parvularculaceae bacterium]|nr:hypothetical protein [Parvularculaceae bacterium]